MLIANPNIHKRITYHQYKVPKMINWPFVNMFELKKVESTRGLQKMK